MKISNKIKVAALALAMMFGAVASAALPTYADVTCPNGEIKKGANKHKYLFIRFVYIYIINI